jgi:TP901-1 family phage major tail protein
MSAQKGKDLLLKLDSDGAGTFVTVAGLRTRALSINAAGRWRELLEAAGTRTARLSGSGIFKDASADAIVRQYLFDGTIRPWQAVIPDFGTIAGPFQITHLEYSGRHDGEVAFELTLDSAGPLTFTAL